MTLTSRLAAAAVVALPLIALATPAATAATAAAPTLTGYVQKRSPEITVAPSEQVRVTVTCPVGTNVVGGGALLDGPSTAHALNSSNPNFDGRTWVVRVNNSDDGQFAHFRAYAVCAAGITDYEVIEGIGVDDPGGTLATARALCPSGTVVLGGGGNLTSPQLSSELHSSRPISNGWQVTGANANPADDNFVMPYAVCGQRPAGYLRVTGTPSTLKGNSVGQAAAGCPTGTKVLSGGAQSSSTSQSVTVESSAPGSARVWQVFQNNVGGPSRLTPYAVCASAG